MTLFALSTFADIVPSEIHAADSIRATVALIVSEIEAFNDLIAARCEG